MKKMSKHLRAKVLLALALCFCNTMASYALPSQGTLNNTAATINVNNSQMTISGKGHNNIINWATFNVATGETVNFNDKNNYLNLVHGIDMSRIYGTISGGNIVYLVNPNGILFGQGAKLDNIGSFIASTRNISSINQTEFLNNPENTEGVLGSNINGMDNKTYYPSQSQYVPKITVAETQLTKVPGSVDTIVLDGPGGVILKNTAALNQITRIYTNKTGGEIGIGTDSGNIALTQEQKNRIRLINGNVTEAYQDNAGLLNNYTAIKSIEDLKNVSNSTNPKQKNMMLWNDIDASNVTNYNPINTQGTFEGMGYRISGLEIFNKQGSESTGLFGEFSGNIRNLSMEGVHFNNLQGVSRIGGIVGHLNGGVLSNVFASGKIEGEIDFNKRAQIGGLVGIDDTRYTNSEIRNSGSSVFINVTGTSGLSSYPFSVGGIIGYQGNKGGLYNVYNTGNINLVVEQQNVNLGGIVGEIQNPKKYNILGATNTGSLSSTHGANYIYGQIVNIGGIVGATQYGTVSMGDTYNFGNIYAQNKNNWWGNQPQQIILSTGGTVGKLPEGDNSGVVKTVSVNNKPLDNVYIANSGNARYNTNFGESKTASEMAELYDKDMKGIYNTAGIGNGAYSGSSVSGGNDSGTTGGNTGGNDSGTTGGNTGGNDSGTTGGHAGGNGSGTTGGNTGGNDSGTTGGNAGGNGSDLTNVASGVITSAVQNALTVGNNNEASGGNVSQFITQKAATNNSVNVELQGYNGVVSVILNETQPNSKLIIDNSITDNKIKNINDNVVVQIDGASVLVPWGYGAKLPKDEKLYGLVDGKKYGTVSLDGNMYIKDLKTEAVTEDKNIKVIFDVYNRESTSGVVEVYNSDGEKIKTEWVDPFKRHAESVKETFEAFSKLGTEELTASKTSIEIAVPAGGYFRVTNNENNSSSLKLHNAVNRFIEDTKFCKDLLDMLPATGKNAAKEIVEESIEASLSDVIMDAILKEFKDLPEDMAEGFLKNITDNMIDKIIKRDFETKKDAVEKAFKDNLKKKLSAKGLADTLFYTSIDAVSGFTKPIQDALFTMNTAFNKIESGASKNKTARSKSTNFIVAY